MELNRALGGLGLKVRSGVTETKGRHDGVRYECTREELTRIGLDYGDPGGLICSGSAGQDDKLRPIRSSSCVHAQEYPRDHCVLLSHVSSLSHCSGAVNTFQFLGLT